MPLAAACAWLFYLHSFWVFVGLTRGLVVYHAGMARHPLGFLITHAIPSQVLPVAVLSLALMASTQGWRRSSRS